LLQKHMWQGFCFVHVAVQFFVLNSGSCLHTTGAILTCALPSRCLCITPIPVPQSMRCCQSLYYPFKP
jgi:hypothetical protein